MINMLLRRDKVPDPVNNPVAKLTTPDRLIAAAVIESLGTDFNKWKTENLEQGWTKRTEYGPTRKLYNVGKSLRVEWKNKRKQHGSSSYYFDFKLDADKATVNGVEIDAQSSRMIIDAYDRIYAVEKRASEVARKARMAMQANEDKWQLAEKLLGMKRNEFGALVPIKKVD
jgi:predicted transcriptional regulator